MTKYVGLWEMDSSKVPDDPKESVAVMTKMIEMTKQWLKDNPGSEWGNFIGETRGYVLSTKSPEDVMKSSLMFRPYVNIKMYQAASIDEFEKVYKSVVSMMQQM